MVLQQNLITEEELLAEKRELITNLGKYICESVPTAVQKYRKAHRFFRDDERFERVPLLNRDQHGYRFIVGKNFQNGNAQLNYQLYNGSGSVACFILTENKGGFSLTHRYTHPGFEDLGYGSLMLDYGEAFVKEFFKEADEAEITVELGQLQLRNWLKNRGYLPKSSKDRKVSKIYDAVRDGETDRYSLSYKGYIFPADLPLNKHFDIGSRHPSKVAFEKSLRLRMAKKFN